MEKAKIIIVEDDRLMAECLEQFLLSFGHEVSGMVSSAEDAIKAVKENVPDLILMDIVLDGKMDGIEAADKICSEDDVTVVYITAYSDGERLERARKTGPFGYVIKPFEKRELEVVIAAALYKKRGEMYLKDIEKRCSFCLESFRGIIFRSDLNFMPIFVHGQIEEITGFKDNDIVSGSINLEEIIHPEERIINSAETMEKLRTVPNFSIEKECRIICQDKQVRWVKKFVQNVCDDSGKPIFIQGIVCDITKRKNVEELHSKVLNDLKNFVNMTVGRENRMIELKKEVNMLSMKLGREEPYEIIS
ncbi:MAG: response regulator [Candidatus Omnitrophica bacterium]|nr:response regulator [Candidatus Omnitrophota bacterium]MBU1996497.1 response regulator [Candidatus Omnitrophota bacterium]MBU4333719.1 response regulator [Candidatus Omnitrophota bacterium]